MQVNATGYDQQRIGLTLLHLRQESLDVAAALEQQISTYRTINGMLHDDVEYRPAIIDDCRKFTLHTGGIMLADQSSHLTAAGHILRQDVAAWRSEDLIAFRPQNADIPHDDLAADRKFPRKLGSCQWLLCQLQSGQQLQTTFLCIHADPS